MNPGWAWSRRAAVAAACTIAMAALTFASCSRSSPAAPSPTPDPVEPATPMFQLSGTVRAEQGTPVAGARVEIVNGAEEAPQPASTDDQGRYQMTGLPAGDYALRATADGFAPATADVTLDHDRIIDFTLIPPGGSDGEDSGPGDPEEPVRLVRIDGLVVDADTDEPLTGAHVEVTSGPNAGRTTVTNGGGRYSLPDLEPGAIVVAATFEAYVRAEEALTLGSDTELVLRLVRVADPEPPGPSITGHVMDILSGEPLSAVTVRVGGGGQATSGADGAFSVAAAAATGPNRVTLTSTSTIERRTLIDPAGGDAALSLIPLGFDLVSFDEMFRARGGLHRWVAPPRLVVERRVLRFTGTNAMSYEAGEAVMTEDEAAILAADLEAALPLLTGGTFAAFASVDVVTSDIGEDVRIGEDGRILVARFEGLTAAISAWGYGRWAWNDAGEVQQGAVMLDREFDGRDGSYRRSLRTHELGHALGYDHVSKDTSVMHVSGRIGPTSFDHDATRIAFERKPLNRSPDVDPDTTTISRAPGLTWAGDR